MSATSPPASTSDARERILATAYELFSHRGIRAVGVDEIIETAGVAKATLYRHFPSKDDLVLAFLQRREDVWTHGRVEGEARSRADDPPDQLLAIFDVFDEWFHSDDFEASVFINFCLRWAPRTPPAKPASTTWKTSGASSLRWSRKPGYAIPNPSSVAGTSSCRALSSPPPKATSTPPNAPKSWAADQHQPRIQPTTQANS